MFAVVLVHPEIPPNTGNVIRLTANTATELHLVEPLGLPDGRSRAEARRARLPRVRARPRASRFGRVPRGARRAGAAALVRVHHARRRARCTTRASRRATCSSSAARRAGLPDDDRRAVRADARLRIPMRPERAQPQPVERRRRRRLRGLAAARVARRGLTASATSLGRRRAVRSSPARSSRSAARSRDRSPAAAFVLPVPCPLSKSMYSRNGETCPGLFCTAATNFFACSGSTRESYSPATTSVSGRFTPCRTFWYGE